VHKKETQKTIVGDREETRKKCEMCDSRKSERRTGGEERWCEIRGWGI